MSEVIFVDSSAFFALKFQSDADHKDAQAFYQEAQDKRIRFVTTNLILFETVTLVKARIGIAPAIELGKSLRSSNLVTVVPFTDSLERQAWVIFDKYTDKDFSFIDCASFAFMQANEISRAFAFDRDFTQYGLQIVPA